MILCAMVRMEDMDTYSVKVKKSVKRIQKMAMVIMDNALKVLVYRTVQATNQAITLDMKLWR
jgi:hypothetical protein